MRPALLACLAGLAGLALADDSLIRSIKEPQIPPIYPIGTGNGSIAKVVGRLFEIDGRVGFWSGANAWYLGHLMRNDDVDLVMSQLVDTGYKIIRVWAFADTLSRPVFNASDPNSIWYQLLPLPPNTTSRGDGRPAASAAAAPGPVMINYGPDGLQRLDYAVSAAERFGLKLVLPFTNTWPDYGGKQMYTAAFGCNETAWFTDATCQAAYRDWVSLVVNRYKASSAIFSWQLGNEPRCPRCKVEVVREWAKSTSEFIKAIDPAHMVTLGDEGWFGPAAGYQRERDSVDPYAYQAYDGVDFVENLNIDTLDYGTFHLYPSHWGYPFEWGKAWIRQHDDAGAKAGKPVVLEEFGNPAASNHTRVQLPWLEAVRASNLAADQVWQFGPVNISVDPRRSLYGDEWSIYYGSDEWRLLARDHVKMVMAKTVHPSLTMTGSAVGATAVVPPSASSSGARKGVRRRGMI